MISTKWILSSLILSLAVLGGCAGRKEVLKEEITPPSIAAQEEELRKLEDETLTRYKLLGQFYLTDKRWSQAVGIYKKALTLAPTDAQIIGALKEIKKTSGIDYRHWPIAPRKVPKAPKPQLRDFINDLTFILSGRTWRTAPTVADIDNDGDMELIVCEENGVVNVWHHDGTPAEGWPRRVQGRICSPPAVGDLDGDGKLEIVVNGTYVWRWNGIMMDGWPADNKTGSCFSPPALSDLNGDGNLEVINGSAIDHQVYVRDYRGRLLKGWPQPTGGEVRATPSIGDIDGDGKKEIVVGSQDGKLYIWNVDSTLLPGWPKRFWSGIEQQATLADIDKDGKLDIVVGSDDKLYVLDNQGNPLPGWQNGRKWNTYSNPSVADIDNDGEMEIFGTNPPWYNHDGSEIPVSKMTGERHSEGAVAGDIDGDGKQEVIWTTRARRTYAYRFDGTSPSGWPKEYGGGDGACTLTDLDGDGDVEVIAATGIVAPGDDRVYVWDAPGQFSKKRMKWPVNSANNRRTGVASRIEWPGLRKRTGYRLTPIRRALIKGDYQSAIRRFEKIANSSRNEEMRIEALLSIARIYNFRLKQYEKAFDIYRRIIMEQFNNRRMLDAFTELCDLYARKMGNREQFSGKFKEAVKSYRALIKRKKFAEQVPPGQVLYLLAHSLYLAEDEQSIEIFRKVQQEFENTPWAYLARKVTQSHNEDFTINLILKRYITYEIEKKNLRPGDTLSRKTTWDFEIEPQAPFNISFPCKTTIITDKRVLSGERGAKPKVVKEKGGKTELIWDEKLSPKTHSHYFWIKETVKNKGVRILRKSERMDGNRQKITVSVTAPFKASVLMSVRGDRVSIEDDGISPQHSSKTGDIIVFGVGNTKLDYTKGQDFTFIITVSPEYGLYYPDVILNEKPWEIKHHGSRSIQGYSGKVEDYQYHISSLKHFDLKNERSVYQLRYFLRRMTE